jgi:hypothetical protein
MTLHVAAMYLHGDCLKTGCTLTKRDVLPCFVGNIRGSINGRYTGSFALSITASNALERHPVCAEIAGSYMHAFYSG